MHVVRLLAPAGAGEDALKDVDFSRVDPPSLDGRL